MKSISILGVTVNDISRQEAREIFSQALSTSAQLFVCTPNPEILLYAHRHPDYAHALNHAHIALPDGRGLQLVAGVRNRVTGVDASRDLIDLANQQHKTICCIVRADGRSTVEDIRSSLARMAPSAKIVVIATKKQATNPNLHIEQIRESAPHIIFVGLGFPEQELWLDKQLQHIPSARIGIAIGGAFDFWTGAATRAPRFMQTLGIEWVWRVIQQPKRIHRIWNAVVIFPFTVWFTKKANIG